MPHPLSRPTAHAAALFLSVLFVLAAGCGNKGEQHAPPPPEVGVQVVEERAVPIDLTYMARVAGVREVEVRARVSGILQRRLYKEGTRVKEGDLLFRIDPAPYAAEMERGRAQVGVEQARAAEAHQQRKRFDPLVAQGVVSRSEYDQAVAAADSAEATLTAARAALRKAELDLSYTLVRAPISGLTSRETRSEGSLVNAGDDSALLTRIAQTDKLYVQFSLPSNEAALVRPLLSQGVHVIVQTSEGRDLPQKAALEFLDTAVDQGSGTVQARATLQNGDKTGLLPGQFARARIDGVRLPQAAVIPARAVLRSGMGAMVWVVGAENKVQPRPVQLGQTVANDIVVTAGLKSGERVIVDGVIKVQPGAVVKPIPVEKTAPSAPPAQAQKKSADDRKRAEGAER